MRKLVTIRAIKEVVPIEGADAIELVKIDGWQCVAKKGEFQPEDYCVYFEVDSFLPESDNRFSFMAGRGLQTNGDGSKGYRLRTIKLRGQLSQGLALPVTEFGDLVASPTDEDLAELINVKKWEPALPPQLAGQAKGTFPSFIKKTDQERIQNMPWVIEDTMQWMVTQKLDGSSMTVFFNNGEFGVCSRNLELKETEGNTFWTVANHYGLREKLTDLGMNIALQGELVGPGIQGNPHGLPQHDFYLFNIWLIDEQRYATPFEQFDILHEYQLHAIEEVPTVKEVFFMNEIGSVEDLLKMAEETPDALNRKNKAPEGFVFHREDGAMSFKVISNKYLIKEK